MNAEPLKRAVGATALAIIVTNASLAPAFAQSVGVTVIVNGQQMTFDQPPIEQTGRIFVPLRGIFEQLGASVVYQNGTINATGDGRTVSLQIGSNQAVVNGQTQTLDSPPFVQGSRTLVPLRFVAQALGANVDWNNSNSTVTITGSGYHGGYNGGPGGPPPMNPNDYVRNRQPNGLAPGPQPAISGNFTVPMRQDSIHVLLDGQDITSAVYFNRNGFEFTPRRPLYPGRHNVRISGVTRDGASFSTGWDFRV
jgi:Copper amine oxidase N-terminal domain